MQLSLINPFLRVAKASVIPSGHVIKTRVIYDYELIYLESGTFTFIYDGNSYRCNAGDLIFIRPGIPHSFLVDSGDISQPHIHFDITYRPQSESIPVSFKNISEMTSAERALIHKDYFSAYPLSPFITAKNRDALLRRFYSVITDSSDTIMKKAYLLQILSDVINDNFPDVLENPSCFSVASHIKDYIDAGNGLSMSLDGFANTFFHSKFYLERKFKEAFNVSLIEYRNVKRMETALHLLKKHSVSRVAELLGYESIYSFSRAFKLYYGYPPTKA